ncbi:MAG: type 4a pilus biogenesis protein PilO [Nitrospinota bacterium]
MMKKLETLINKIPFEDLMGFARYQRLLVVVVLQILIVCGYFFLVHAGKLEEIEERKKTLSRINQDIRKFEVASRKLPELEAEIKKMEVRLKKARANLPDEKEIPRLLKDISNIGTRMGLQFLTFKPLAEKPEEYYSRVPVNIKVVGQFHDILNFFDNISRMSRIVTFSNVNIATPKTASGKTTVVATCVATTFRYLEQIDKPKKKKA